jgi:Na+/H+ antiporter NhaD/arsenite permease-like protein
MTATVVAVFLIVYAGMFFGRLPRLQLDRTGVALLGAIALLVSGATDLETSLRAVDVSTLALLFALMVVSAQLRLGGFYEEVTRRLTQADAGPAILLAVLVGASGALAAVFSNDVICLAVAPVLIDACRHRGLNPVPFLLGLVCAANVGSAATLIGNPQNMLIGQTLQMSFGGYLLWAVPVATLGLIATWGVIAWQYRGGWGHAGAAAAAGRAPASADTFDRWQSAKGLAVVGALLIAFLVAPWPRELVALAGAGVLLTSRKLHSRRMLGLVDWQLLVLFVALFVVNDALQRTGALEFQTARLAAAGVDLTHPAPLFAATVVLSNLVSNVPTVMLLLPLATHELAGPVLALASTLSGNLLIVGSIANIIVVDIAAREGIVIDWRRHLRTGLPVTLVTLAIAAVLVWLRVALR